MDQQTQIQTPAPADKSNKSRLVAIIVSIIVLIALGVAGCYFYSKFSNKSSTISNIVDTAKTTFNPQCKYNDPDLCKFVNNWKDVKYMTMSSTTTGKDGSITNWTMKTEGDSKSQMISRKDNKEDYNTITIDSTYYTKDYTDNKWFKYVSNTDNSSSASDTINTNFDKKADSVEDNTTYKKIGEEKCDKYNCLKYQVIDPSATNSSEYIYFDTKEYLLRKTVSEDKDGSVTESTFDYSKVTISEPSPTKEGDPYSSAPNTSTATSTTLDISGTDYSDVDSSSDANSVGTETSE